MLANGLLDRPRILLSRVAQIAARTTYCSARDGTGSTMAEQFSIVPGQSYILHPEDTHSLLIYSRVVE